ncbi:MAG: LptE family protein [Bacteroidia bacterium]
MLRRLILFALPLLLLSSCHVNYSMTGASISPDTKTINIKYFPKTAALGPPSMSQTFTEKLKDKFQNNTSLSLVNTKADLTLEGTITGYVISPQNIQSNEQAAQNRLTITVSVKFTNIKNEKQNFESSFSRYADYDSNQNISSVEESLINTIYEQIVDDIFNKAVINW